MPTMYAARFLGRTQLVWPTQAKPVYCYKDGAYCCRFDNSSN